MNAIRRTVFSFVLGTLISGVIVGQEHVVNGTVKDENGVVLKGVEVQVKSKSFEGKTDGEGNFTLQGLVNGDTVSFSFINYKVEKQVYTGEEYLEVQLSPIDLEEWEELSLEDMMNIEIVSASKKSESVFESPLSSTVITKEDIERSGATSIPECLRLAPGVIVREQTNGVYDVHLRGFDYIPPKTSYTQTTNNITLVMIDNRIVYNYLDGGTFWQSLPIDLNDVERIEIIRGPSAALYGPNAVAGVIHIITRRVTEEGFYAVANAQAGNYSTLIGNASLGFKKSAWSAIVSGNYQTRNRYQESYYIMSEGEYMPLPDSMLALGIGTYLDDLDDRYPEPEKAFEKYGINGFLQYNPKENINIRLSGGYQDAQTHQIYFDMGATPFCVQDYATSYYDIDAEVYNFSAKFSQIIGEQLTVGSDQNIPYNNLDFNLEYNWEIGNLSLRPGISYKHTQYNWISIGGEQYVQIIAGSLRGDYVLNNFRFVGALRVDKYNTPDEYYPAYQILGTYKLNKNNMIRLGYSRSNRAPFLADSYFDMDIEIPGSPVNILLRGNKRLELLTMDMVELGFRSNVREKFQIDIELFYGMTKNYTWLLPNDTSFRMGEVNLIQKYKNLDIRANQLGTTIAFNYIQSEKFQAKVYFTFQQTNLQDFAPVATNQDSTINMTHEHTPAFYGGFGINYRPVRKLNINANGYFFTDFIFDHEDYTIPFPPPPQTYINKDEVPSRFVLNLKVSYSILDNLSVFFNSRNILNSTSREFGFTDDIGGLYLIGMSYSY